MMADKTFKMRQGESGMVLVVSLIILVIVTLLAISALRVTTLEERMAGNTRDRNLAFEATEYALREAQDFLSAPVLPAFSASSSSSGGLFTSKALDALKNGYSENAYWATVHDWNKAVIVPAKTGTLLSGQARPRYVIEEYQAIPCKGESQKWPPPQPRNIYLVTARGTGRTTDAEVMLQIWYDRGCSN